MQNDYTYSGMTTFESYQPIFQNTNIILIPKKIKTTLTRYVSKESLRDIDTDITIAIEKCLIILSNLDSTFYTDEKYKALHSLILRRQVEKVKNDNTYKKCIELLKKGTTKGPILLVNTNEDGVETYEQGVKSKQYRLADTYLRAGLTSYTLTTKQLIDRRTKVFFNTFTRAMENPIANNLIKMYGKIDLPSTKQIIEEGKKLIKEGYTTKKGKILTLKNKHSKSYWSDADNRSFVEDGIEIFNYLTNRGYMLPIVGDEKSGGRVVDSFNLMPSWIRNLIMVNNFKLIESDFTCLHPNLAIKIFGGNTEYLNHNKVAEMASIDLKTAKIEHLSFFNKHYKQMEKSPLFDFYTKIEPKMMENIRVDKNKYGYKSTSGRLFKMETSIMTEVVEILNSYGIYVIYVYDALYCEPKHQKIVNDTMNDVIAKFGVKTIVSGSEVLVDTIEEKVAEEAPIEVTEVVKVIVKLKNKTEVVLLEEYIQYWDEIKTRSRIYLKLLKTTSQTSFNYELECVIEDLKISREIELKYYT